MAQNSKSSGMGGAVSGAADSSFGGKARGVDGFLSRCTIILGIIFAVLSLVLGAMIKSILMMKACFAGFFFFTS